ncbi:hypothetical protein [Glaciecola sp. MH2013]|uniref:hypothetical protein n=1 Tax=Glaciecola sp. MH2013 TaxID=2785524 RepID=UPI00189F2716|nr:hypothetical protein [Glaciecola sp. MH2013]
MRGGKFGHGFFSAGITKGLTPYFDGIGGSDFEVNGYNIAEAAIAGILGGTISEATGGKFANGAITAAMGNLFNNQSKKEDTSEDEPLIDDETARALAEHGITVVQNSLYGADGTRLGSTTTEAGGAIISVGISLLDAEIASRFIQIQTHRNIKDTFGLYHPKMMPELQEMNRNGNYFGVIVKMAEYGYEYKGAARLLELGNR